MEWELERGGAEAAAIALAILFGALLLVIYFWNRATRRSAPRAADAEMAEMHAAMTRLQAELPDLLRSMNSRLDAKMQALRNLIRDAGATIEELRRASNRAAVEFDSTQRSPAIVLTSELATMESSGMHTAAPARADSAEHQLVDLCPPDTAELRLQRYAHVYSLADSGLDPAEISGETGMHRGEVELVLNLRRKRVRVDRGSRSEPSPVIRSPEEAPA
jgi:Sec-independent protein translocase protein TatA